jgi:hypothetical protein
MESALFNSKDKELSFKLKMENITERKLPVKRRSKRKINSFSPINGLYPCGMSINE